MKSSMQTVTSSRRDCVLALQLQLFFKNTIKECHPPSLP